MQRDALGKIAVSCRWELSMADDELNRTKLTFRQAEGLDPLPERLKLKELSPKLRSLLWEFIYDELMRRKKSLEFSAAVIDKPWADILRLWHTRELHKPADEWKANFKENISQVKKIIWEGSYDAIFQFLQFVMRRSPSSYNNFARGIAAILESCRAAYYVELDGGPPTIMPAASEEEAATVQKAFADLHTSEYGGARAHLRRAGEAMNAGDFAGSVRESIHAVESVAKTVAGADGATLEKALQEISKTHEIHPAFQDGLRKLYAWTNDEKGIRHAHLADPAKVDITDAQFMLGACAAFVSYLIEKSR